jgi:hypothetical protein
VVDSDIAFDDETNEATVKVEGLMISPWQWERGVGSRRSRCRPRRSVPPDRRACWRDIPVAMPGPFAERTDVTVLLPESDQDYALEGKPTFETEVAGVRMNRQTACATAS